MPLRLLVQESQPRAQMVHLFQGNDVVSYLDHLTSVASPGITWPLSPLLGRLRPIAGVPLLQGLKQHHHVFSLIPE